MQTNFMQAMLAAAMLAVAIGGVQAAPSLERGDYLVNSIAACGNCHSPQGPTGAIPGMELSGQVVDDSPAMHAVARNITPASRIAGWTDAELIKAIREGIRPDGSLIGPPMPFEVYKDLSDDDVASMVMYLRTVPAVESDPGESVYNIPLPPAWGPPVASVASIPEGVTVEYGEYLANALGHCTVCHTTFGPTGGPDFENHFGEGGNEFHGPWGVSVSANITPTGIGSRTDEEIAAMITTGVRPGVGPMLPPMPYAWYARMKPDDVAAVILYLRTLPPKP